MFAVTAVAGRPMAEHFLSFYNAAVIAYGQTGSGKTHTMLGTLPAPDCQEMPKEFTTPKAHAPVSLEPVTSQACKADPGNGLTYVLKASMLQIYQETVYDLLHNRPIRCTHRDNGLHSAILVDPSLVTVTSAADALKLLQLGASNRAVAETGANPVSSRSHCIFTLHMEARDTLETGVVRIRRSRLQLVDLAGSERSSKGIDTDSARQKEANAINKSLSALSLVIDRLLDSSGTQGPVPYRDSKLTFMLQDCLGGNAKTLIIANINPSPSFTPETHITLRFAFRAMRVSNQMTPEPSDQRQAGQDDVNADEVRRLTERNRVLAKKLSDLEAEHSKLRVEHVTLKAQCEAQRSDMSVMEGAVEQGNSIARFDENSVLPAVQSPHTGRGSVISGGLTPRSPVSSVTGLAAPSGASRSIATGSFARGRFGTPDLLGPVPSQRSLGTVPSGWELEGMQSNSSSPIGDPRQLCKEVKQLRQEVAMYRLFEENENQLEAELAIKLETEALLELNSGLIDDLAQRDERLRSFEELVSRPDADTLSSGFAIAHEGPDEAAAAAARLWEMELNQQLVQSKGQVEELASQVEQLQAALEAVKQDRDQQVMELQGYSTRLQASLQAQLRCHDQQIADLQHQAAAATMNCERYAQELQEAELREQKLMGDKMSSPGVSPGAGSTGNKGTWVQRFLNRKGVTIQSSPAGAVILTPKRARGMKGILLRNWRPKNQRKVR
ncbi:hypothetical protein GPECTOR_3g43 [Gonium pectorale]|uniref:Kinesin-like protein n=1 Tax=Gonium pectorale TaxID=33097 RepID=A0A150GZT8_GONPE|nr:hypothetical protein GPECTOR_3g43 [Gonium pectorale]|eukprot:KXZ55294.1 hypothetical protein GPECTOR_3g43 [Gonium pectorale]